MQLTKALIFSLVGSALALPTANEKRQLATIQGAVTSVQQSLQKLDTAVKVSYARTSDTHASWDQQRSR